MLRSILIYLSKAAWAQKLVTGWKFAWRAASRFVAGNTIQDAVNVVKTLNAKGISATLDHLGESTSTREEAIQATDEIVELLDQISCCSIQANVSVKLTQLGLSLDEELCANNLERILIQAKKYDNFIRIDMEDTPYTDQTIAMLKKMRGKGYERTGLVVQSYLYRTEKDIIPLLADGVRIRLVKGAYKEPAELAYPKKVDVDMNFDRLAQLMIDASLASALPAAGEDSRIPPIPALGTHDPKRIEFGKNYASKVGLQNKRLEFQMLFGIRRDLQDACVKEGYSVRIYVPYGTHWYPYYMRRLAERPANIWFFISNYFKK